MRMKQKGLISPESTVLQLYAAVFGLSLSSAKCISRFSPLYSPHCAQDALGRAQKSVTVLASADDNVGQKVTFTVRKMGAHNGAAFGVKGRGLRAPNGSAETGVREEETRAKSDERHQEEGATETAKETKSDSSRESKEAR